MSEESTRAEVDPLGGRGGRRTIMQMVVVGLIASVLVICSVPVFVLVATVVLFAVRDFRMRPGQENLDGPPIHGNTRLEVIWTAVPAILLVSLCSYAYIVLHDAEKAPAAGN